jgi:hypothetical protein
MGRFFKKALRFGAFTAFVVVVFFTNIVHKLGFANVPSKDDKNGDDLFASFGSIPTAYADQPATPDSGPNCDAGPCSGPCPH